METLHPTHLLHYTQWAGKTPPFPDFRSIRLGQSDLCSQNDLWPMNPAAAPATRHAWRAGCCGKSQASGHAERSGVQTGSLLRGVVEQRGDWRGISAKRIMNQLLDAGRRRLAPEETCFLQSDFCSGCVSTLFFLHLSFFGPVYHMLYSINSFEGFGNLSFLSLALPLCVFLSAHGPKNGAWKCAEAPLREEWKQWRAAFRVDVMWKCSLVRDVSKEKKHQNKTPPKKGKDVVAIPS